MFLQTVYQRNGKSFVHHILFGYDNQSKKAKKKSRMKAWIQVTKITALGKLKIIIFASCNVSKNTPEISMYSAFNPVRAKSKVNVAFPSKIHIVLE